MSYKDDSDDINTVINIGVISICSLLVLISLVWGTCALGRVYSVWANRKEGEAELARAESNRQIKTLEAKAKMEGSKHLADAEIIRAKGVAEANRIIGDSLQGNEAYLRYLWIHNIAESNGQVIYIPTEANLPLLEATRVK